GTRTKQVEISIRRDDVEDAGANLDEVAGILQSNGVPTSAGELKGADGTAPVEVGTRIRSIDAIKDLVISGEDDPIKISDVADVELVDEPVERSEERRVGKGGRYRRWTAPKRKKEQSTQ